MGTFLPKLGGQGLRSRLMALTTLITRSAFSTSCTVPLQPGRSVQGCMSPVNREPQSSPTDLQLPGYTPPWCRDSGIITRPGELGKNNTLSNVGLPTRTIVFTAFHLQNPQCFAVADGQLETVHIYHHRPAVKNGAEHGYFFPRPDTERMQLRHQAAPSPYFGHCSNLPRFHFHKRH